nr:MAG TPA: hypothetical protein [Caudoviricetes sp.]
MRAGCHSTRHPIGESENEYHLWWSLMVSSIK